MLRVVWAVAVCVVLAACGDDGLPKDGVQAALTLECTSNCVQDKVYLGTTDLMLDTEMVLDIEQTNDPRELAFVLFSLAPTPPFVNEGYETFSLVVGRNAPTFYFKCVQPGTWRVRSAGFPTDDRSVPVFELFQEITCVPPAPPDIEVRGPNGGVIPTLGEDAAGVKPHGVQFTREYTIKNIGTGPLSLMTTSFAVGTNCTGTVLVQATPTTLAPGAMGSMTVGVTPTVPGMFQCEWALESSDPDEDPYSVTVTGIAPAGDIAIVAPSSTGPITDGGQQAVGSKPAGVAFTETYRIDNDGLAFLTVGAATIGTRVNCTVSITSQPITTPLPPQTLGATNLVLSITPTGPGPFMCDVSVPSTDPDAENPYTWTITGTGTAPEIDVANFPDGSTDNVGGKRVGTAFSRSYMIANTGTGALTVSAVTPGTMNNCTLTVSMAPAATVAPAGMTMFTISVTPTAEGSFACGYDITNNDSDEAFYDLAVAGTGVTPKIALEGPSGNPILVQGSDDLGGGHQATVPFSRTYTIKNVGTDVLTISSVSTDTPTCNNCTDSVGPPAMLAIPVGGSTTFTIQWTPTNPGGFGHSYKIISDSAISPLFQFGANGVATAAPAPSTRVLFGGGLVLAMSTQSIGTFTSTAPIELDYQISNVGDADLVVTSVDSPGMPLPTNCTVSVTGGTGTITPLTSSTFHVTVTPSGNGSFSFQLRVSGNDPSLPMGYVFAVTGTVQPPSEIDVPGFPTGSTDNVGSVFVGSPIVRSYTVSNQGAGPLTLGTATFTTSNCTASVSTAPASPVAPSGTTPLGITVTPTAAGAFSCTLHLPNNDATGAENPYDITISGTAAASLGNFSSKLGNHFGDGACGVSGYTLRNASGLRADGFGTSPDDFPFVVGADPNVATGTNMTILGVAGYTCTLSIVGAFTINIDCTKPAAPSCHEISS